MTVFDGYIIGIILGILATLSMVLAYYWISLQPKLESSLAAFSRGFNAGWKSAMELRNREADEELTARQEADLRIAGF